MDQQSEFQLSNVSPVCLLRTLARCCWMIVLAALTFVMAAWLYLHFLFTPQYTASMTYAVSYQVTSQYSTLNFTAATEVAAVLTELLHSDTVYTAIRSSDPALASFSGSITSAAVPNTNFINISISAEHPQEALLCLFSLQALFPDLSEYISSSNVLQVIRNPAVSATPSNLPDVQKLYLYAGAAGALLMICLILAWAVLRQSIQTRDGARNLLDAPVLALIGHERQRHSLRALLSRTPAPPPLITSPTVSMGYTEQIHALCSRLEHDKQEHGRRIIMVTSAGANEGKSTLTANLAISLARRGNKVALIDADLRNPTQFRLFQEWNASVPLSSLLEEPFRNKRFFECAQIVLPEKILTLFSNAPVRRATELLGSPQMAAILRALRQLDFVLIDTPPVGPFPDAELLGGYADSSLLVVRQDGLPAKDLNDAIDALRGCHAAFLGCVLNDMWDLASSYGYGYGYGKKKYYGYYSRNNHAPNPEREEKGT